VEVLPRDGAPGWGEATILTGYTDETVEGAWALAQDLATVLVDSSAEAGEALLAGAFARGPFTVSAFRSAHELAAEPMRLSAAASRAVPLLAGINAVDPEGIESEMEAAIARGFGTLKIKVGFDANADAARMRLIQRLNRGRARLRVDGNQGFTREEACAFAAGLDPDSIELLEQPCAADDWDAAAAVAKVSAVPMMLDESIYGEADIRRAAALGCARFVKLKLMKMGGIAALEAGLRLIRDLGMEPVLGNGVASEIGCWAEAAVAAGLVRNAGEFNGFLRPRARLLAAPMEVRDGAVLLLPGRRPRLIPTCCVPSGSPSSMRSAGPDRPDNEEQTGGGAFMNGEDPGGFGRRVLGLGVLAAMAAPRGGLAQAAWAPTRPIRMVVPYAPGGGADTTARLLARPMGEALGQPVVVENRAGAAGTIGAAEVARSAPDGHTVLLDAAAHTANPSLLRNLPFDYAAAFAPVSQVTVLPMLLLVRRDRPVDSLAAFIAHGRAARSLLNYGSAGNGTATHLACANLVRLRGFEARTSSTAAARRMLQDLMAGSIDFAFAVASISLPLLQDGRLRALAVSSARRLSSLADLPTVDRKRLPDFDIASGTACTCPPACRPLSSRASPGGVGCAAGRTGARAPARPRRRPSGQRACPPSPVSCARTKPASPPSSRRRNRRRITKGAPPHHGPC
jgi:tripartite-type tricarboxylate transporter receptor subunit TctC/L-alanine-DL-glutamate epimerase-like enolase superfamily enzyme